MLTIRYQSKFKKDVKLLAKRGFDLTELEKVIDLLAAEQPLPPTYKDHPLSGNWTGNRECHIHPDWLLIYRIDDDVLVLTLVRSGTHSDLLNC